MVKYREILRLDFQNVTKRGIASSCKCSRNTITEVLESKREGNFLAITRRNWGQRVAKTSLSREACRR